LGTVVTRTGRSVGVISALRVFFYVNILAVLNLLSKYYVSLVIVLGYQVDRLVYGMLCGALQNAPHVFGIRTFRLPLQLCSWLSENEQGSSLSRFLFR